MLLQSLFGRLAGYEDVNDTPRLRHAPAIRCIIGGKAAIGAGALPCQMGRFETSWLARSENLAALANLPGLAFGSIGLRNIAHAVASYPKWIRRLA